MENQFDKCPFCEEEVLIHNIGNLFHCNECERSWEWKIKHEAKASAYSKPKAEEEAK